MTLHERVSALMLAGSGAGGLVSSALADRFPASRLMPSTCSTGTCSAASSIRLSGGPISTTSFAVVMPSGIGRTSFNAIHNFGSLDAVLRGQGGVVGEVDTAAEVELVAFGSMYESILAVMGGFSQFMNAFVGFRMEEEWAEDQMQHANRFGYAALAHEVRMEEKEDRREARAQRKREPEVQASEAGSMPSRM